MASVGVKYFDDMLNEQGLSFILAVSIFTDMKILETGVDYSFSLFGKATIWNKELMKVSSVSCEYLQITGVTQDCEYDGSVFEIDLDTF